MTLHSWFDLIAGSIAAGGLVTLIVITATLMIHKRRMP